MYDVEARGIQRTKRALVDVGKRGGDVRPVFQDVRAVYRESNARRFESRGGGQWPALKESTKKSKARRGLDPRVMRATNALHGAMTAPRAKGQVNRKKADMFRMGTSLYYARFHDVGEGGVPVRKLIELTEDDMRKINHALEIFIAADEREIQSLL